MNYALKHNVLQTPAEQDGDGVLHLRGVPEGARQGVVGHRPIWRNCVRFTHGDMAHETTVAQLAFLLWARDNGVWDYTLSNATKIEDMRDTLRQNRERAKKNRKKRNGRN